MVAQCLAAQQHVAGHAKPVGEGQFDGPCLAADHEGGGDHVAIFAFAIRRGDGAPIDHIRRAGNDKIVAPGNGVHRKAHLWGGGRSEGFDVKRVKRRGAGAGIDLDLERGQAEIGQGDPFFPSEPQHAAAVVGAGRISVEGALAVLRFGHGLVSLAFGKNRHKRAPCPYMQKAEPCPRNSLSP